MTPLCDLPTRLPSRALALQANKRKRPSVSFSGVSAVLVNGGTKPCGLRPSLAVYDGCEKTHLVGVPTAFCGKSGPEQRPPPAQWQAPLTEILEDIVNPVGSRLIG